jgi:N-acetylglucosamine-6-sulfatase
VRPRLRVPAALLSILVVAGLAVAAPSRAVPRDTRMNVVVIVSDDQTFESIPHDPPAMPKLQRLIEDPAQHWIRFPNAFVDTPLCCPSRASILTGRYAHDTGVVSNTTGDRLDDTRTIATALQAAGYTTALVGKYLNGYPFGFAPTPPPGWDTWFAKLQGPQDSVYEGYALTDDGFTQPHGATPEDYSTDVYADAAADFIRTAPEDRPFFLLFTPMAPHAPWTPARRDAGTWRATLTPPPSFDEPDVSDKPAWVRRLPRLTPERSRTLRRDRRLEYETLGALDDAVQRILDGLQARGALENTVVVYLTDNGFSFGEHRWVTKSCPYDECIRTPFFVRFPSADAGTNALPVSNVDLAPTIAQLANAGPPVRPDGRSIVPLLRGRTPVRWPSGALSQFHGDARIPPWSELRTARYAYVEYRTGERELYDLEGSLGRPDPYELRNVAGDPRYAGVERRLAVELRSARDR